MSEAVKELFCKPGDERALLSYCLSDMDYFYDISTKMTADDFLLPEHKMIFMMLDAIHRRDVDKFDMPMVINEINEAGVAETVGGIEYLLSIQNMELSDSNFDVYLNSVVEASTKYKLHKQLKANLDELEENSKGEKSSIEYIGNVEAGIMDLSTTSKSIKEPINIAEGLGDYIQTLRKEKIDMVGIPTGYPILDTQIDGLVPGTLLVIAARKKMGKSALLTNMATHIAFKQNTPILYIDTEMTFPEWRNRVIAMMSGVDERVIKHGGYSEDVYATIMNKCVDVVEKRNNLYHEFMPGFTTEKVVAIYKKYAMKHNMGVGFFDYLKEPDSASTDGNRKEHQILGDVTTKLKDLAGQLGIPFVTAVQLGRHNDIADSDRIARFADIVAHWGEREAKEIDEGGAKGSHKLVIKDTRRGGGTPDAGIGYYFFKKQIRIKEVPIHDQLIQSYGRGEVVNRASAR